MKVHLVFQLLFLITVLNNLIYCQLVDEKIEISLNNDFYNDIMNKKSSYLVHRLNVNSTFLPIDYTDNLAYAEYISLDNLPFFNAKKQNTSPYLIEFEMPFKGKPYNCILKQNHIISERYKLNASGPLINSKVNTAKTEPLLYHGIVEGQEDSWVTLSYVGGHYRILIAHSESNIEVHHRHDDTYIVYQSDAQKVLPAFDCTYIDKEIPESKKLDYTQKMVGSDCVELYLECDYQSFIDNGSSISNTEAWALSIINDVSTMYNAINVPIVVSQLMVHNTPDPYQDLNNVLSMRDSFVNVLEDNYTGRIAQLLSTRQLGGGLAYGIDGLCGSYPDFPGPYTVATSLSTSYTPYPNFSYTVYVVAHELGHVFGARHTHACVWGTDGNTQLDDCGNIWAIENNSTPEGQQCYNSDLPILPSNDGGTVMSFCNLTSTGINLANGFNIEVGDFIFEKYSTASCATGGECATLIPNNDNCNAAKILPVSGVCNYLEYDNILASASGTITPSCGSIGVGNDVWFTFAASNIDMNLQFNPNVVEDVIVTVYSGSCGNLTEFDCVEGNNEELFIKLNGLTVGNLYFIRIIESGSDVEGVFELCVSDDNLPCHPAYNALVDLYNSTNGVSWLLKNGWQQGALGNDCDVCNWYGITCDNLNNVIGINLKNNNLSGTLPITIGDLTYLRSLKIYNNTISGSLVDVWGNMQDLEYLDVSNNLFTGNIPISFGSLLKLRVLYIEKNNLDGPLLPSIGSLPNIDIVWMKENNLSGCYPGSYLNLCVKESVSFKNNPLLHDGGVFSQFCIDGSSGDIDMDGFCYGLNVGDDCVDDDNTIYPGAPELCDGKDNNCNGAYDENLISTNTWTTTNGGDWSVASNWSLGVPLACQDVIIPTSTNPRNIVIAIGEDAYARSVTIQGNSTLINNGLLTISGSDNNGLEIDTNGACTNNAITIIKLVGNHAIYSKGNVINFGTINASTRGIETEVYIELNGDIECTINSQLIIH